MTPLIRATIAWGIGIGLARIITAQGLTIPWPIVGLLTLPAMGALLLYRTEPHLKSIAVLGLVGLAGISRFLIAQPHVDERHIAFFNESPQPITLTGTVADFPDVRQYRVDLRLEAESIQIGDKVQPVEGLVLVRAARYPEFSYGDRLKVQGKPETPPIFENFSYRDYLARFDIYTIIRRPEVGLVKSNQGNPFWAMMFAFKKQASATLNQLLAEPYASLLNGILLGIRSGIPDDLYEQFNLTGTSHVIVISGSNISLIAGIFLLLGRRLFGRKVALPLAISGVVIYTFLVGADASVSRAAVMGVLFVVALAVGRPGLAMNSLFASALLLSLVNPLILWDVGFQLSFMATLGLIWLVPPLEQTVFAVLKRRLKTDQPGLVMTLGSELLILTLAAQIMTLPLIIYHFGRLSLVSLLSNLLIVPAQPPIMVVGGLAMLAGMVWLPLGQIIGWMVWLPLAWSVAVVEWTAGLPYASLEFGNIPLWLVGLVYLTLMTGIWAGRGDADRNLAIPRLYLPQLGSITTRLWLGGLGTISLLTWLAVWQLPDGYLHITFLDVGQGDAILITLPDGRQLLIDGGPLGTDLSWRLGQEMPFWDRSLDVVLNTHPDADHLGGLVPLLDRYQVGQIVVADVAADSQLYRAWEAELAEHQHTPVIGLANSRLALGAAITATILNPGPASTGSDEVNNHSIVLRLQYGNVSLLLPGDIEAPVEQALVRSGAPLAATILKSPHHGSKTSSGVPFLRAVNPQIVVVSAGADNWFGHPAPEVLERYRDRGLIILRTDEQGTVELITDGQQLWVETDR